MTDLKDKFFGCIAATNIASAMGAAVEGMHYKEIEKKHGYLEKLLPYNHYNHRDRMAGTTEDGIERQRLLATAYIEKNGRITVDDLKEIWLRDINPDNFNKQMEPCDEILYKLVKAGMPPRDVGHYSNYPGIVSFVRSAHPVGLINAGYPEQAARDSIELGSLYQPYHAHSLEWGAAYNAAIAEALTPDATITSVIKTAENFMSEEPWQEVKQGLQWVDQAKDYKELRKLFYKRYNGKGNTYGMSMSHELVTKGFALFKFTDGDPKETILKAVNMGRDTDCTAAIASGLSGAYAGSKNIPEKWVKQVDEATLANKYTVSQRLLKDTANGLYKAYQAELNKLKLVINKMEKEM
ncbi:MAG: ADP-ribosylglycohydrolase family protein [Halanaerobiales bacterium]